ncbi:MAG: enoyl-CoA hydratase/isomerase family protein [Rhizobiaceae bacterium]
MSDLRIQIDGPIAELCIDNPAKLNALTPEMLKALEAHCERVETDDAIRAVVLTAEGERAFCAGADINAWSGLSPRDFARHWIRDGHRIFDRLARLSKPTIAAIGGHAFGGGLELATACDIRIMAPEATLALPEAGVGVVPGWSGTQRLARLMTEPVLKEMAIFGRRINAERAHAIGFVAEIADEVRTHAFEVVEQVISSSPRSIEITKYMIHGAVGEDSAAMIEALGGGFIAASDDKAEGVAAFRAKRQPSFSGN